MVSRWSTARASEPARPGRIAQTCGPTYLTSVSAGASRLQALGDADGEAPGVDQHHRRRASRPTPAARSRRCASGCAAPAERISTSPTMARLGDVEGAFDPLGRHLRPADARPGSGPRPADAFSARASPAPSASPEASQATSITFSGALTRPRPTRGRRRRRARARRPVPRRRRGRAPAPCRPRRRCPARPARAARCRVPTPMVGRSTRVSWIGLGALARTPIGRSGEPRTASGSSATRRSMASVPSCASTASTSPRQTTAPWPMSSRPMARATSMALRDVGQVLRPRPDGGPADPAARSGRPSPRARLRRRSLPSRTRPS